jgi:hypothetical protein
MPPRECPGCGARRIYRSRRSDLLERLLATCGAKACRCHDCNARYIRLGRCMWRVGRVRGVSRKLGLAIIMAAAVLVLLGAVLYFGRVQGSAGELGVAPCGTKGAPGIRMTV